LRAATEEHRRLSFSYWLQAARLKFLSQGVMPVVIAGAVAFGEGSFSPVYFTVGFLAAAAVQLGLTMFNDTLDFVYGTDRKTVGNKNPFSGGSGLLVSGIIRPGQAIKSIFLLYFFALICAIYLAVQIGFEVMWIAVIGALISIFYSAKPFRFAYHGLGEVMMFLGYGPVLTAWGYFIHTSTISIDILLIGAIPGFLMWTMILINEIPDYNEDRAANKRNIAYRLGPGRTKNLYIASLTVLYVYIAVLILSGVLPVWCALASLSIPLAVKASLIANRHYLNPIKVAGSNRFMVYIYSLSTVMVAAGIFIEGLLA